MLGFLGYLHSFGQHPLISGENAINAGAERGAMEYAAAAYRGCPPAREGGSALSTWQTISGMSDRLCRLQPGLIWKLRSIWSAVSPKPRPV